MFAISLKSISCSVTSRKGEEVIRMSKVTKMEKEDLKK
jgi:hypothetical protein